jgi:hypothetical protein
MTVIEYHPEPPEPQPAGAPERTRPTGGIYDLPLVGGPARNVREFYDELAPTPTDSTGVIVGKQLLRYGTVVAAGTAGVAVGAIIAL